VGTEILIADDHPLFRDGMRRLVQRTFPGATVREAATFDHVLAVIENTTPDLFVLDLHFPGFDVASGIATLRQKCPTSSLMFVSMTDDGATIDQVLAAGADGFISKAVRPNLLSEGLRRVLEGEFVRLATSDGDFDIDHDQGELPALTSRQKEVLHMLTRGMSNKEMARAMGISPFTVRIHVTSVLRTLGVATRAAAAATGREMGF